MTIQELAKYLVREGKGIFAADAGDASTNKRLIAAGAAGETAEDRRKYREVLFTTKGLGEYVSGVIMHEESLGQSASDGRRFADILAEGGVIPGVKVDQGLRPLPLLPVESITRGLDTLPERLVKYYEQGARFTKWRAVYVISDKTPTSTLIRANAQELALYALFSQAANMVPIIEPEVLMDGEHSLERCAEVTEGIAKSVFDMCIDFRVNLEAILYKTNMAIMGKHAPEQLGDDVIAKRTVEVLNKCVSVRVPGVVFLSGGQESLAATRRLNEIAKAGAGAPWRWTFSFERAFEEPTVKVWAGKDENVEKAQAVLLERARLNSLASLGRYTGE